MLYCYFSRKAIYPNTSFGRVCFQVFYCAIIVRIGIKPTDGRQQATDSFFSFCMMRFGGVSCVVCRLSDSFGTVMWKIHLPPKTKGAIIYILYISHIIECVINIISGKSIIYLIYYFSSNVLKK
jgi:hypothetical protein